jgi:hypothetical protein
MLATVVSLFAVSRSTWELVFWLLFFLYRFIRLDDEIEKHKATEPSGKDAGPAAS